MSRKIEPTTGRSSDRWLILALCCAANFLVYFHRVTPAVMVNELRAEFGGTSALIGVLSSAYFYTYMLMQIPVGYLTDRVSPRYLIGFGIAIAGAASMLFGISKDITWALFARALTGLGVSTVLVPAYKILGSAFGDKFMMANGIIMAAGASGALVATSPLVLLIDAAGWRAAFFVIAMASFIIAVPCLLLIRGPWDAQKGALGKKGVKADRKQLQKAFLPGMMAFFKYGPLVAFQGLWGVPFLMDTYGMLKVEASQLMLILSVSTMAGGLLVGQLLDRTKVGLKALLIGSSAVFSLCWLPLAIKPGVTVLPFIYASVAMMGASDILVLISANNYIRRNTGEEIRGTVMGIINSITLLGGAVFQPLMGVFINGSASGYQFAFSLGLASSVMSLFVSYMLSRKFSNF